MKITREEYVNATRIYELDINQEYVDELNNRLASLEHPKITMEMILAVWRGDIECENVPELNYVLHKDNWSFTLEDWIYDEISSDIWDSKSYIDDEDTEDFTDKITTSEEEEERYKEYKKTREETTDSWDASQQLSIFDTERYLKIK